MKPSLYVVIATTVLTEAMNEYQGCGRFVSLQGSIVELSTVFRVEKAGLEFVAQDVLLVLWHYRWIHLDRKSLPPRGVHATPALDRSTHFVAVSTATLEQVLSSHASMWPGAVRC